MKNEFNGVACTTHLSVMMPLSACAHAPMPGGNARLWFLSASFWLKQCGDDEEPTRSSHCSTCRNMPYPPRCTPARCPSRCVSCTLEREVAESSRHAHCSHHRSQNSWSTLPPVQSAAALPQRCWQTPAHAFSPSTAAAAVLSMHAPLRHAGKLPAKHCLLLITSPQRRPWCSACAADRAPCGCWAAPGTSRTAPGCAGSHGTCGRHGSINTGARCWLQPTNTSINGGLHRHTIGASAGFTCHAQRKLRLPALHQMSWSLRHSPPG